MNFYHVSGINAEIEGRLTQQFVDDGQSSYSVLGAAVLW
jgi:hypothetical protein